VRMNGIMIKAAFEENNHFSAMASREEHVYMARVAEQAERYEGTVCVCVCVCVCVRVCVYVRAWAST
jgi:hypothetical protein